jgi:hypothetical protein
VDLLRNNSFARPLKAVSCDKLRYVNRGEPDGREISCQPSAPRTLPTKMVVIAAVVLSSTCSNARAFSMVTELKPIASLDNMAVRTKREVLSIASQSVVLCWNGLAFGPPSKAIITGRSKDCEQQHGRMSSI